MRSRGSTVMLLFAQTSCELTSSHLADLTREATSDALPRLEQDSLPGFHYQMELSVLHAAHQETGIVLKLTQAFKPVQIPTAFKKAFLQGMLLKTANISQKSLSIKSVTCKRERINDIPINHFYCSPCECTY